MPLWGKELREEGYDIPLPFGVSVIGFGVWQDTFQESLRLSFDEAPPVDVSDLVEIGDADNQDGSVALRLDAFILPFFNIYMMGGVNTGKVEFDVIIEDIPIILPGGGRFRQKEEYTGGFVGGGGTMALGWKQLFWMADGNGTWAKTSNADSTIIAATFSTRAGWRGDLGKVSVSAWLGTMFMHFSQTVETSVEELGLSVELETGAVDPWNMLLGGQIELGRNWAFLVEGGFIGRQQVLGMVGFRF